MAGNGVPDILLARTRAGEVSISGATIKAGPFSQISFDTYANSFYESYWVRYTKLRSMFLELRGSGKLWCAIFRQSSDGASHKIQCQLLDLDRTRLAKVPVRLTDNAGEAGRIYAELYAVDGPVHITSLTWCTASTPPRSVSVSVVICTYHREAQVIRTLRMLTNEVTEGHIQTVYVVNQATPYVSAEYQELTQAYPHLIRTIDQPNQGGTGGFGRGVIEALADASCNYVLLLDDDAELGEWSIPSAVSFASFSESEIVVGGQMLSALNRTSVFDSGGRVEKGRMYSNHRNLNLECATELRALTTVAESGFSGWWFAMFPVSCFRKHGLPLPFFVHVDDVEYGTRLAEAGVATVVLPPVCVWHEPYIVKPPCWFSYYDVRNWAVFASLYPSRLSLPEPRFLLRKAVTLLLRYDYQELQCMSQALMAFVDGPGQVDESAADAHGQMLAQLQGIWPERLMERPDLPEASQKVPITPATVRLRMVNSLVRILVGLPKDNAAGPECLVREDMPTDFMQLGRMYAYTRDDYFYIRYRYSRRQTWKQLRQVLQAVAKYARNRQSAAGSWRQAQAALASLEDWAARLRLTRVHTQPAVTLVQEIAEEDQRGAVCRPGQIV